MLVPAELLNFTGEFNLELCPQGDKGGSYLLGTSIQVSQSLAGSAGVYK